jgi:high-affinity K+ transport system ATPase subunit B
MKPVELLLVSAVLGLFTGVVVLMSSRDLILSSISFGAVFIVCLVSMAMFVLAIKPNKKELLDIEEQDHSGSSAH